MAVWLIAAAFVLAAGVWCWWHRKGKNAAGQPADIPPGKEEIYAVGLNPGEDGKPVMYTLTTCRHCVHLKNFLEAKGIEHHLVYVDEFHGAARTAIMTQLRSLNPRGSFPTLVVPGGTVVVGFREGQVRAALGLTAED